MTDQREGPSGPSKNYRGTKTFAGGETSTTILLLPAGSMRESDVLEVSLTGPVATSATGLTPYRSSTGEAFVKVGFTSAGAGILGVNFRVNRGKTVNVTIT